MGDTATYYGSAPSGSRRAVDVGFCAAAGGIAAGVSSYSWVLVGADGKVVRPAGGGSAAPTPAYPDTKLVGSGACLRGWVAFDVPAGTSIARIGYQPDGDAAPLATWTP